jgi:L,D-peptidoglycan transpeptidase YkuD (ErfK/YbiS/YcfS/YnhG family)
MKKLLVISAVVLGLAAGPLAVGPAFAETAPLPQDTASPTATDTAAPTESASTPAIPAPELSTSPTATAEPTVEPTSTVAEPTPTPTPTPTEEPTSPSVVVLGAIQAKWTALKGAAGALGAPTANQACSLDVCSQAFEGGSVFWTAATGAHPVLRTAGHTGPRWHAQGGLALYGYPVTDETAVTGGTIQKFSSGRFLTWTTKGIQQIWSRGAIGALWRAQGEAAGLGLPTTAEVCGLTARGCSQFFAHGAVFWSPRTPAQVLKGTIYTRWKAAGAQAGVMGYPTGPRTCGQAAGGCLQRFQGGTVYWSSATGSWISRGGLGARYVRVGATRSSLGYPLANEKCVPGQCIQAFQRGFIGWTVKPGYRVFGMSECQNLNNGKSKYPTYGANRVLLTWTQGYGLNHATNLYCMKIAGTYVPDWRTDGYVGKSGFKPPGVPSGPTRNLFSPTGSFSVTEAFGLGNPGTKLAYRTLNPRSRWGGNPWTATYNKYHESSSWVGWDENMWWFASLGYYRQGVVINYNRPNIVQDAGFAIFLHMNKIPTAGCLSLDDWAVVDYIRKSTPGDRIIMGTYGALFR